MNDYVPFYFTPFSPMLKNIYSGYGGIRQRPNEDIVFLVSNLYRMQQLAQPFVFTDSHAYYAWSNYYTELADLDKIDWYILQRRDFRRDADDPGKFERYQAEALIYQDCPVHMLEGIICYTDSIKEQIEGWLRQRDLLLPVHTRPRWYF